MRAWWVGHRLHAELDNTLDATETVEDADRLIYTLNHRLTTQLPFEESANVRVRPDR